MRRGLLTLLVALLALGWTGPAGAASWAKAQIKVVVDRGLMAKSANGFRPEDPLTRRELAQAMANLTGEEQVVVDPDHPVALWRLDRALVRAAGLLESANAVQAGARDAGVRPPARFGSEVVARLLGLRPNHPAAADFRELRPHDPATRAEAAYSLAVLVGLSDWSRDRAASTAASFALPELTDWQRRVLRRAAGFVGYPYVWGGMSESTQTLFGVTSRGGFDCSGFVWRVYKLQRFSGAPQLRSVLRGRTTYEMSGEVPRSTRIGRAKLRPGDVIFFGAEGPQSAPSQVDHMGIYAGNGWFVHSSGQGTTMTTLTGWYETRFAWGRRPLREAGLA